MDPMKIEETLEPFVDWVSRQEELPQNMDKILLLRYLKASEFDIEKAKNLLKNSLKMRHKNPHIFTQRDPWSKEMQNVIRIVRYVPLIDHTPKENFKVTIVRLIDNDPEKIVFNDVIKAFFMAIDTRLVMTDEVWASGEIPIFDMTNITLRHFTKVVFSTVRLFMKYCQETHPVTIKQIHIVNCNSIINRAMIIVKPFLRADVAERIQTHLPDSDTLYKYVPKEILPKEYGGYCGSIDNIWEYSIGVLDSRRDYLLNDENWKLNI